MSNPALWTIDRNHKMHFCVYRVEGGKRVYLTSASGRPSSFKTHAGAFRAMKRANNQGE